MRKSKMKKSMSVFLAALLLMSAWVFVPGDAYAADKCTHTDATFIEVTTFEATCVSEGFVYDKYRCNTCSTEFAKNLVTLEIDASNHNIVEVQAKAATCEEEGWNYHRYCRRGCDVYADAIDKVTIPATGHEYKGTVKKPATCYEAGEMLYTCKNDSAHTYTEKIPVTAHLDKDPEDGKCDTCGMNICLHEQTEIRYAQSASCSSEGYTGDECCKVCGLFVKSGKILPILDHTFGSTPIETVKETCVTPKVAVYKCKNCPEKKYEPMTTKDENGKPVEIYANCTFLILSDTEPSCIEPGYFASYCTLCAKRKLEVRAPKGHVDENQDGKCDILGCGGKVPLPGGQQPPCDCMCHDESSIMQFFFKVINFFCKLINVGKECECGVLHY